MLLLEGHLVRKGRTTPLKARSVSVGVLGKMDYATLRSPLDSTELADYGIVPTAVPYVSYSLRSPYLCLLASKFGGRCLKAAVEAHYIFASTTQL